MQMPMDRTMPSGEGVTPAQGVGSSSDLLSPTWLFDRLGPHRDWIGDALSRILGDQSLSRLISLWPTLSQAKGSAVVVLQRIFLSFLLVRAPLREEFVKKAREFVAIVVKDLPWDQIASDENNFESSHVNLLVVSLSLLFQMRPTFLPTMESARSTNITWSLQQGATDSFPQSFALKSAIDHILRFQEHVDKRIVEKIFDSIAEATGEIKPNDIDMLLSQTGGVPLLRNPLGIDHLPIEMRLFEQKDNNYESFYKFAPPKPRGSYPAATNTVPRRWGGSFQVNARTYQDQQNCRDILFNGASKLCKVSHLEQIRSSLENKSSELEDALSDSNIQLQDSISTVLSLIRIDNEVSVARKAPIGFRSGITRSNVATDKMKMMLNRPNAPYRSEKRSRVEFTEEEIRKALDGNGNVTSTNQQDAT